MQDAERVLIVDHAGTPGGGQLGLLRYLRADSWHARAVAFMVGGPVADQIAQTGTPTWVRSVSDESQSAVLLTSVPWIRKVVNTFRPTVVMANSHAAMKTLASTPLGNGVVKLAYLREGADVFRDRGLYSLYAERYMLAQFDGFIANSRWTASTLPKRWQSRPIEIAYPISGLPSVRSETSLGEFAPQGVLRVATFSRPDEWKGIDLAIDALKLLHQRRPELQLTFDMYGGGRAGDAAGDPVLASLLDSLETCQFSATHHGHISGVTEAMAGVDVLVLPSRRPEPFGQVVAQGLSLGLVVVVAAHGGALEQVSHGENGLTFEPNSVSDLARVLEEIVTRPDLVTRVRKGTGSVFERFSDDKAIARLDESIGKLARAARNEQ